MVKILFITVGDRFGSGKALLNLINGIKNTYDIKVVYSESLGLQYDLAKMGIETFHIPMRFDVYPPLKSLKDYMLFVPRLLRDLFINKRAETKLKALVMYLKPDIVHTNVGVYRIPAYVCYKCGIPHVWHLREYQTLDMGYNPYGGIEGIVKTINKTKSIPICITKGLASYYGLDTARIIYDGIKRPVNIQDTERENASRYYLFVGNITKHKGCSDLINTYVKLIEEENMKTPLLLAGGIDSVYAKKIMAYVENKKMSDIIRFIGFRDDVYSLMRNAKALIVPSIFECFGLITAEGMYNKCLIIGRDTGGTKEQMDNAYEFSGRELSLRFTDNDGLRDAIMEVENGKYSKYEVGSEAFNVVDKLYSIETNCNTIKNIYEQIVINKDNGRVNNHC
ncbi:glycosyltransferase family 4 protein [Marseilla massiliensis]|uniref:Glycosyltransferase family 4 protein n=1 Tax=Marseilla massiliensis TaxID=1841864 RepID=A0A938WSR9_9BACT|nr:glycosyltransferase family 4 protein [Marseilla massiliensis]MBM6673387.1 glycosyltransferase family 4 protein [Marseilla massiliensis]